MGRKPPTLPFSVGDLDVWVPRLHLANAAMRLNTNNLIFNFVIFENKKNLHIAQDQENAVKLANLNKLDENCFAMISFWG